MTTLPLPQSNLRFYHNVQERYSFGIDYRDNCTVVAFAFCNPKDQFCRKTARSIIVGRIGRNIGTYTIPHQFKPEQRKYVFYAVRDLVNEACGEWHRIEHTKMKMITLKVKESDE